MECEKNQEFFAFLFFSIFACLGVGYLSRTESSRNRFGG